MISFHSSDFYSILNVEHILGGGVAVGSLLLIEEDEPTGYHSHLMRYFLAEGLALGHELLVVSADAEPSEIVTNLPSNLTLELQEEEKAENENSNSPDSVSHFIFLTKRN